MKLATLVFTFLNALMFSLSCLALDFHGKVLSIHDGDTITVSLKSGTTSKVRLLGTIVYNGVDINQQMLFNGWSAFYLIAPFDKTLAKKYSGAAKEAFLNQQGIYSKLFGDVMMPYLFRMKYSGKQGRNLIGNIETKSLSSPEDIENVPVYNRVFFSSEEIAFARGYHW